MAIEAASVTVSTTATALNAAEVSAGKMSLAVKVPTGGATVYVGPAGVTTATGFPLAEGESIAFDDLEPGERVYGIVAAGTQAVNVIRQGVG